MSKSKSHPCKHPKKAIRPAVGFMAVVWCHKCKQYLDSLTSDVVKQENLISGPVPIIMEGSPSGT